MGILFIISKINLFILEEKKDLPMQGKIIYIILYYLLFKFSSFNCLSFLNVNRHSYLVKDTCGLLSVLLGQSSVSIC